MISKVSFNTFVPKALNNRTMANTLERSPKQDSVSFSGIKASEVSSELKEILDKAVFKFKKYNGEIFEGTIKEYLQNCHRLKGDTRFIRESGIIHNTYSEDALAMIKNGLDWTKTSRVQCGPGTYFIPCQNFNYGPVAIEAKYTGKMKEMPVFEKNFYEAIVYNKELRDIVEKSNPENPNKVLNKYCHDLLTNDMGIDVLYSPNRESGCYVVLNDKSVNLRPYNFHIEGGQVKYNT